MHALAHCILEPVEFSRVVMYFTIDLFSLLDLILTFSVIIYHMHQLLNLPESTYYRTT